ncbi:hypothetical protein DFH09DRAFT_648846 [Mycena vulgaris]|nr:hypothetical protein DFH09DRAFT_648846 [Mycena vulgaris]
MSGGRGCFNCGGCALSLSSLPSPLFPLFFEIAFELFRETYSFYIPGTLLTTFISSFYNHSIPYTNAGVLSYRRGEYTLFPNALSSVCHENRIVNSAQSATKRLLAPRPERLHAITAASRATSRATARRRPSQSPATSAGRRAISPVTAPTASPQAAPSPPAAAAEVEAGARARNATSAARSAIWRAPAPMPARLPPPPTAAVVAARAQAARRATRAAAWAT